MSQVEGLLRRYAPQVLGALVRRYGHFYAAEDAVQEALLAAAGQWPVQRIELLEASAGIEHRVEAVRGHLLERAGEWEGARAAYESAARWTLSVPEQRYLRGRAARLSP